MNKLKNEYVKEISNLKSRINRYDTIIKDVNDAGKERKRNLAFSKEISEVNRNYNAYKNALKKYNKGETEDKTELNLAKEKLDETIFMYKRVFNKQNKEGLDVIRKDREHLYYSRLGSIKNVRNINELDNKYKQIADILNKLTEQYERKQGKTKDFTTYTTDDIYDKLYSGANESPYYEEIVESIAEDRKEFISSIIKPLRDSKVMSNVDYMKINNLLGV